MCTGAMKIIDALTAAATITYDLVALLFPVPDEDWTSGGPLDGHPTRSCSYECREL